MFILSPPPPPAPTPPIPCLHGPRGMINLVPPLVFLSLTVVLIPSGNIALSVNAILVERTLCIAVQLSNSSYYLNGSGPFYLEQFCIHALPYDHIFHVFVVITASSLSEGSIHVLLIAP